MIWFDLFVRLISCHVTTMSISSKAKNVKPKGTIQELKLVQKVSRRGANILKTEEVKRPNSLQHTPSSSHSPIKRRKTVIFDEEPIPCHLEVDDFDDSSTKRKTLVFPFPFPSIHRNVWQFLGPKWLLESVLGSREDVLESPSQLGIATYRSSILHSLWSRWRFIPMFGLFWVALVVQDVPR